MLVPPENHQQELLNSQSDNSSLKVDPDESELRIAKLVGLSLEDLSLDSGVEAEATQQQTSLSQPSEIKTEQSLSSNPFAKLGLVGTATLALVLFAGGFLTQLMNGNNQPAEENNNVSLEIEKPIATEPSSLSLEGNIENLKTQLALKEQLEAVKSAQQELRGVKLKSTSQTDVSGKRQMVSQRIPTPMSTVYVPRIVTVERVIRTPNSQPKPLVQPSLITQPISRETTPQPIIKITPSPTPQSLPERRNSPQLSNDKQAAVSPQPSSPPNININSRKYQEDEEESQSSRNTQPEPKPKQQPAVLNQGVQQSPKSVAVGSRAKAVLATAIFGETIKSKNNDEDGDDNNVFVVRLKEPLKAVDGAIAIPVNTEFLVQIRSLSEQGLLQLKVIKMIVSTNGNLTEKSLAENAITIHAPQGKPLIANQFPNRGGSIFSMDLGLFVLGGVGKAAELVNRSESQVVTTTAGGTIVSNNNPDRNISAGLVEGGINTVVPQIVQRNQQAISQMSQRTNVWFLKAGTAVEIYVNQAMQF
ncbi:TrbI/VirB10 family protein [Tolypothrix sp. PCC 7910]|uniref:TrbI/VirB10 family protein n=1 Tax=Tolypothrix sp. PCC 7910 TaxID=2099387 RepID=UPI001AD62C97|nr:TrbI/VirB10 family protein [Tolypothrix sp. PCC 7910]